MGPKHGRPPAGALVGDARGERRLRPDDDQVDRRRRGVTEVGGDLDVVTVAAARPCDRLLAAPAADDEDTDHYASAPSNESLAWASSTAIGYRPVKHALQ